MRVSRTECASTPKSFWAIEQDHYFPSDCSISVMDCRTLPISSTSQSPVHVFLFPSCAQDVIPVGSSLLDAAAQFCIVRLCYLGMALKQHYLFAFPIPYA